jgi:ATP-binding cassette, subfamily B, bacterial PglK
MIFMMQFLSRFLYVTKGKYKALSYLLFLFLLISFLELLGIGLIGPFISLATNPSFIKHNHWLNLFYEWLNFNSEREFLLMLGLLSIVIFYVKSFISFNAQKSVFEFGYKLQAELMTRLLHAYLAAPYTFHLNKNSSSIIQNIVNETHEFCNSLTMPFLTSISNGVVISALIFLLIKTDAMAMIIILGIGIIAFTIFYFLKNRLARWGKESSEAHAEMIRLINHSLGGLKETRIFGCEPYFEQQMKIAANKFQSCSSNAVGFSNLPRYTIEAFLITFLIGFTILFITINQGKEASLTSVLGIFALASIRLLPATGNLFTAINSIKHKSYSLDKLYFDLKELESINLNKISNDSIDRQNSETKNLSFHDEIILDKVIYRYPNAAKNSLEEISLTLKKGESIGLIGKSGAGKTTLVDVILGLLQPEHGDIKVDGNSIYKDLRAWQNLIGYVPQSIFLIDDTLERNIALGVQDHLIDRERLKGAIQAAQLSDLVEQLPNGIQTRVGERGVLLSGGQRQRVGIARALYHEREILVFDEATAALDNETEALVTESIKSLSGIKTMIVIAHRLSTIEHCDLIYMLDRGKIVKAGNYEEVVLRN